MEMGTENERGERFQLPHTRITSLEEQSRIIVSIPAVTLRPGQPFTQEVIFSGHQIIYEYGYSKDNGPLNILELKWVLESPEQKFFEKHDGQSLPVLNEPGEYIFVLKLLHDRSGDPYNGFRWEEVVLFWTLIVSEEEIDT